MITKGELIRMADPMKWKDIDPAIPLEFQKEMQAVLDKWGFNGNVSGLFAWGYILEQKGFQGQPLSLLDCIADGLDSHQLLKGSEVQYIAEIILENIEAGNLERAKSYCKRLIKEEKKE